MESLVLQIFFYQQQPEILGTILLSYFKQYLLELQHDEVRGEVHEIAQVNPLQSEIQVVETVVEPGQPVSAAAVTPSTISARRSSSDRKDGRRLARSDMSPPTP